MAVINRKQVAFTIDKKVVKNFNEVAKKLGSNKSQVMQLLMERWIKENNDKK